MGRRQLVALALRTGSSVAVSASDFWSPGDSCSFSFASSHVQAVQQEKKKSLSDQTIHLFGWTSVF